MKRVCPRCQQSYVERVRLIPLNQSVFLCDECDSLWTLDTPILLANYRDFDTYMRQFGYCGDWTLVEAQGSR